MQESTAKFIGAFYKEGWSRYFSSSCSNSSLNLWEWSQHSCEFYVIVSNEQFVLGISYHMKQNYFSKKCVHRFSVAHWKCTDVKFENWTSIADGYMIIHPQLSRTRITFDWLLVKEEWLYLGTIPNHFEQKRIREC